MNAHSPIETAAPAVEPIVNGAVIEVPLNRLKASPRNVRKVPHTAAAIESRAASIAAKGVLQPLVIEPELGAGGEATGNWWVTIGEGRRQALRLLASRKRIKKTHLVRCVVVINTNRRTYHLDLSATVATAMVSVAWRYPQDEQRAALESARAEAADMALQRPAAAEELNFGYRIEGARPVWRPSRVFDDGRQTVIEFPASVAQDQLPPLFVGDGHGRPGDLVNYRVKGRTIIVDRIFAAAELRLGDRRNPQTVRIVRRAER